jgi:Hint domain
VVNSGTISDTILYNGAGVQLAGGGTVTNSTGGAITSKWIGVQIGASQTASVGGTVVNLGSIFASDPKGDGAGVWIHGPGTVINGATGTIVGGGFGVVAYYQTTLINQGSIGGSEFAFDPAHTGFANRVVDTPGAVFRGTVDGGNTIGSTIVSTLELASASSAGTITGLGSQFVDFGQIVLDAGANWSFGGTVVAGQTIGFGGSHAALTLLNPNEVGATITGFGVSDTIVMPGIANTTGISFNGNTLTVSESVGPNLTLVFGAPQALAFSVVNGATDITVACFAEGTRIQTKTGATLVEALRPGMPVISVFGGDREIVWVGHRRIDCTKHPRPLTVWPIQIEAGAFGPGLPAADLRVSPDHAIYVNEVLIPARHLVNGTTIRQVPVDEVTYYHVELHRHDVLLAEGLPAESYLDTGNRSNFSGSLPVQLFPDFSTPPPNLADVWEAEGCAPLVIYGPELEAAQALVNRHALAA